ncbi:MAG TPA: HIT domain-containing protein [Terriglobales bacterium]|jgi:galactose-1-phosphate uridylyltransferase|nr:HIT domain-containing protein [Terriglobales bacterium]
MPELRQNYFTKEWVTIATERAKRPEELATHRPAKIVPPFIETCPFCAGNESKTPPEVMRVPTNGGGPWRVHVLPKPAGGIEDQQRVVLLTDHFVALELYASPTPFCTPIYPRRHMASFGDISNVEMADLARVLKSVLAKIYHGLGNPDFNFTIRSAPAEYVGVKHFHWYVSIIPRLTRVAGFELGSGMFINTVLPEAAVEFLRNVKVEMAAGAN